MNMETKIGTIVRAGQAQNSEPAYARFSEEDRKLLSELAFELKRRNDLDEAALKGMDRLLSCKEAALYLGVTSGAITYMIKTGKLQKIAKMGRTGIPMRQIERMIDEKMAKQQGYQYKERLKIE